MGRGQLKYRKRGGRGVGGTLRGGRAAGGRGSSGGSSESTAVNTKRSGLRHDLTSHLPSNTEKWGRAFGEEHGEQGRRKARWVGGWMGVFSTRGTPKGAWLGASGLKSWTRVVLRQAPSTTGGGGGGGRGRRAISTSAVGVEETERLLDESEWAIGASSRHLAALQEDDEPSHGAAAAPGELLALNLEVLEVCLRTLPAHERLRLPHALTAQLETQGDGNPAPGPTAALPAREGAAAECARAAAAAGEGGVPEPVPGGTRGGDKNAGLGGPGPIASAGATSAPLAVVGNDEGAVLDTLLGLQEATGPAAAGAGAGGSWRANSGGGTATTTSDEERIRAAGGREEIDELQSCDDDRVAGRKEEAVPAEPPSSSSSSLPAQAGGGTSDRRDSLGGAAALGGGVVGPGAGMDSGRGGGGTDELEDWLDGMLADA
ncbi:hypothetical protein Esi_0304_0004 [Ectocarpus siliculosus]|uniref:Uncharacterized protein n=1 Tax=Ectocarpus siliculosus TaxID=2880 RepID=D8LKQ2_ECTSI|nr:hypothetical protein Esi_0304_0004 [Ectocarpus siliculosus]|eukprot:CBN76087.1 hypothetical protein Esi_0304_0004 [Ectocarpus siliculosus]